MKILNSKIQQNIISTTLALSLSIGNVLPVMAGHGGEGDSAPPPMQPDAGQQQGSSQGDSGAAAAAAAAAQQAAQQAAAQHGRLDHRLFPGHCSNNRSTGGLQDHLPPRSRCRQDRCSRRNQGRNPCHLCARLLPG